MKLKERNLSKPLLLLLALMAIACNKDSSGGGSNDDDPNPKPTADTFEEVIKLGADFEDFPETRTETVLEEDAPENEDYEKEDGGDTVTERFICTRRKVSIEDGSDSFPLFNPNSSIIYPGNLLQGKTLDNATPETIPLKRGSGVISYNIIDGNLTSSVPVDEISLSSVRDAQNIIIAGSMVDGDPSVPSNFSLNVKEIQSKEQLALELGVKIKTFTAKISGSFSVDTSREVNSVMVKLTQQFYTMDVDLPTSPDAFFHESVTPDDLKTYIQADNPAAFISSVTYGRTFYMLFESTSSSEEMKSKLNLGYKTIGASGSGSVEFEKFSSLKNLSLQVIAYGGDASETIDAVANFTDNNSIGDFLSKIGKSSDIRTGLPLSYVVNSVERPSRIVGSKLATEYDVVECELKGILPPQGLLSLVDLFSNDSDGGGIGAMAHVADSNVLVFNKEGTKYAWYNGNSGQVKSVFDIKDENSPLGIVPLDNVGAAIQLSDQRIYLFDKTGLLSSRLAYTKLDAANATNGDAPTTPIGSYTSGGDAGDNIFLVNNSFGDGGNFQFAGRGFEAGTRTGDTTMAFFGKPGDEYAVYSTNDGSWGNPLDSTTWWVNNPNASGELFEKTGAASYIEFGGSSGRWYLVNEEGDEIMEYFSSPTRTFNGPWVIN